MGISVDLIDAIVTDLETNMSPALPTHTTHKYAEPIILAPMSLQSPMLTVYVKKIQEKQIATGSAYQEWRRLIVEWIEQGIRVAETGTGDSDIAKSLVNTAELIGVKIQSYVNNLIQGASEKYAQLDGDIDIAPRDGLYWSAKIEVKAWE